MDSNRVKSSIRYLIRPEAEMPIEIVAKLRSYLDCLTNEDNNKKNAHLKFSRLVNKVVESHNMYRLAGRWIDPNVLDIGVQPKRNWTVDDERKAAEKDFDKLTRALRKLNGVKSVKQLDYRAGYRVMAGLRIIVD